MYQFVSKNVMEDAVAFSWFNSKISYFKALFVYIFVTVAALVSIFANIKDWKNIILAILIVFGGLIFLVVRNAIKKAPYKNGYLKKTKEIIITFDEEKVRSKSVYDDGEAGGECEYNRFMKIKEDQKRIYCYLDNNSALILNKNSIDNIEEFKTFLRGKVNRVI